MTATSPTRLKFLVLSARAPVALDWARQIVAAGHEVYLADYGAGSLSRASGLAQGFWTLPAPADAPLAFIQRLQHILAQEHIDWLIPTCEEVFCVAHYRELLPASCHVLSPDFAVLQRLHHKFQFTELAQNMGITTPPTRLLGPDAATPAPSPHKTICKPVYSRFGHQTLVLEAAQALPAKLPLNHTWLQQDFIHGQEYCSYSLAVAGEVLTHVTYAGKYRYKNGASYYFQPTMHEAIAEQVSHLVHTLNFTGQISFDWMEETLTGRLYALECNPRATSGIHLLPHDGGMVQALLHQQVYRPHLHTKMFAAMMLCNGFKTALKTRQLRTWWHDVRRASDVLGQAKLYQGLWQDTRLFYQLARAQNLPLEAATSQAFEWNGEAWSEPHEAHTLQAASSC